MLEVQHISKSYDHTTILSKISFALSIAENMAILGKSGSGKSTLLKIIGGLLSADDGVIKVNNKDVSRVPLHQRSTLYLFQEALLFPHLNVFENIAFGLRAKKENEQEIQRMVNQLLEQIELPDYGNRKPQSLSGGQKQRVAFARALAVKPQLLLLDEPFGALDNETRTQMQTLFKKMIDEHKITSIFVSHDLREVLTVGNQLAILENGQLDVFIDKTQFINDGRTGVKEEINFWKNI